MKLHLVSDVHLEHWKPYHMRVIEHVPECDYLVLAGDIFQRSAFTDEQKHEIYAAFAAKAKRTFFVAGNHEYYGSSVGRVVVPPPLEQLYADDYRLVEDSDVGIWGDTLWFPYGPGDEQYHRFMNDFSLIGGPFATWAPAEYDRTKIALMENVRPGDIVVTHHLPSQRSVPHKYTKSALNRFFVGDCEDVIAHRKPSLWLHGHTHNACDYMIGDTRVLCNPMGYPGERSEYDATLMVEI